MNIGPAYSQQPIILGGVRQYAPRPTLSLDRGAIDAFAGEITRRAGQTVSGGDTARSIDDKGLSTALTNSVEFVKNTFGDNAGRAVMGIVLSHAGDGPLSEETLGDGFVSALEFIDRNFGIAAGDQAMGFFNGELNQALNGYFQNGKQESFLAMDVGGAQEAAGQAVQRVVVATMAKSQAGDVDPAGALFEQAAKDTEEYQPEWQAKPGEDAIVTASSESVAGSGEMQSQSQAQPGSQTPAGETAQTRSKPRSRKIRRRRVTGKHGYGASTITSGVMVNTSV